ncbi:MAG: FixH family protein [Alphaproteobacteria bacterium]|nr:FixH family protein [Alphaproteobacteria bacterium]
MSFMSTMLKTAAAAVLLASITSAGAAAKPTSQPYRFELVGSPTPTGVKQHAVSVRIVRTSDNKAVAGATITSMRLDMGPENMPTMTAPVTTQPTPTHGIYSFSFDNGVVWAERAKWALTITATVKGEPKPITGSVIFQAGQ